MAISFLWPLGIKKDVKKKKSEKSVWYSKKLYLCN